MARIFPSLTAADQLNLEREIKLLEPYCEGFHLDVMDNHFVPNITWGADTVNAIARLTDRILWVHLMVDNPAEFMKTLALPAGSIVTIHREAIGNNINILNRIKEKDWVPGIVISPKTPVEEIFPLLDVLHHVTIMSVEPGFAGQQFLPSAIEKIEHLIGYRETSGLKFEIALDGGINEHNIADLSQRGVDVFGVASAIFGKQDPVTALQHLQKLAA
jgi:ribulose-phosphate 3-epimerase